MAKGAGAPVHVHLFGIESQFTRCKHRDHGEGFVDLEQVDVLLYPARLAEKFLDCPDRRERERLRCLGVGRMGHDARADGERVARGDVTPRHDERCSPIRDRTRVGGCHGAVGLEGGAQLRDFRRIRVAGLLVGADFRFALAGLHHDRREFGVEGACLLCTTCAFEGGGGEQVHLLAGDLVRVRRVLGKGAHRAAGVCVLEAVGKHRVEHLTVAHALAGACAGQQIGGVGHAFHSPRDHDVVGACSDCIRCDHCSLHPGSAHLVDRHGAGCIGQTRLAHRLAGGGLAQTCWQYAAHDDFVDLLGGHCCAA